MIIGNALTFGGGGLDLTVTGGTARPQSPKENTIWVNSGISLGETTISPIAPTAPVLGDVWIVAANKSYGGEAGAGHIVRVSSDPALEINVMNIQQWDGAAWVNCVNSGIYVGGAWQDMALYLFANGVLNAGYSINGFSSASTVGSQPKTYDNAVALTDTAIKLKSRVGGSEYRPLASFAQPIDFSRYNSLALQTGTRDAAIKTLIVYVTRDAVTGDGTFSFSGALVNNSISSPQSNTRYDVDMSAMAGDGYLTLFANVSGNTSPYSIEITYIALTP